MTSTFTKLVSNTHDQMGEYTFDGTLTINSKLKGNSISGIIAKNGIDIGNISLDINFDNSTISWQESNVTYNWISKETLKQFIDKFITEVNKQYSAYITALNS